MPDPLDDAALDLCEFCGEPDADHRDEWGIRTPCFESIAATLAYHEATGWESYER